MLKSEIYNIPNYAGIYLFKNKVNGKCYIGQAIKLRQRIKAHWSNYSNPRYQHIVFYKAIAKYGWENFEFSILESFRNALSERTKYNLDQLEVKYIKEYDSYNNGYNSTLGGDKGVLGYKHTEECKKIISQNAKKQMEKKREEQSKDNWIKCKNIETGEELIFYDRITASEFLQIPMYSIRNCLLHRINITHKVWIISKYNEEYVQVPKYNSDEYKEIILKQLRTLSNKEEICNYIKENPKCSYGEIKQIFDLSRKTFYNYKNELNLISEQRIDCKATKQEFLDYYNSHSKEECIKYFGICERTFYKYKKKYITDDL